MNKKNFLPALAVVAILASCGGNGNPTESSSIDSSPEVSSSPLGLPTVSDAVAALRAISFDDLNAFTQVRRKYQYNFSSRLIESNYRESIEFDLYKQDISGLANRENLSGVFEPTIINSFQGSVGLYDLTDRYFASVIDYGNDISTYEVYESSIWYDKFDMVNSVDYYCDLVADGLDDPTTYFETDLYDWTIEDIAISEVEDGYEVKVAATVPADGYYAEEDGYLAAVVSKYDYSLVSLSVMTRTCNYELVDDEEADTNLYQIFTLKDFAKGERVDHTPAVFDPSTFPEDNISGSVPEVVEVSPGTLSEATVIEIMANQLAYVEGTKSSTISGKELIYDVDYNEIHADVEATMTAYLEEVMLTEAVYTYNDGASKIEADTLNYGTDEGIVSSSSDFEPYTYPANELNLIGSIDQLLNASAIFFNTTALFVAPIVARLESFGTTTDDYGNTNTFTLHQAECSEDGIITIEISYLAESSSYSSYQDVTWTIDNGFLSKIAIKSGTSAEDLSTDLVGTMVKGDLEEYPGIIFR